MRGTFANLLLRRYSLRDKVKNIEDFLQLHFKDVRDYIFNQFTVLCKGTDKTFVFIQHSSHVHCIGIISRYYMYNIVFL